ncbi:hypothetical protein [Polaromonas naphthalenivorans]|uniref:Uncharacterized protein n=1 Tax=Polaromonas naphthalenivorans (strain CJ2) TaxID=365044 RepID=A1VWG5_POLNA|nr:hypothetical protein [Polaromonas naphthalenivorans]ABM39993.1 hypothetical protein Pnap_4930 [Polaromonas naphthalenivorans CJ2]
MKTTLTTGVTTEQLVAAGGNFWTNNARAQRFYFNDLDSLFGLKCSYYKTGNVFSATLDGDVISNGLARRILSDVGTLKVYFDMADLSLHIKSGNFRMSENYDYESILTEALLAHANLTIA